MIKKVKIFFYDFLDLRKYFLCSEKCKNMQNASGFWKLIKTWEKIKTKIDSQNRLINRPMWIFLYFFSKGKVRNEIQKENQKKIKIKTK